MVITDNVTLYIILCKHFSGYYKGLNQYNILIICFRSQHNLCLKGTILIIQNLQTLVSVMILNNSTPL